jgi:hypothetical protein
MHQTKQTTINVPFCLAWTARAPAAATSPVGQRHNPKFLCFHHDRPGPARQLRREKSHAEVFVVDQKIFSAAADYLKKSR